MIYFLLSFLIILLSLSMLFLNHPLSVGFLILIQTTIICIISGLFINTYWFSYILFLTFLGGLLVLFIYVSSIASNELFNFNLFSKKTFLMFLLLLLFFSLTLNFYWKNFFFNSNDMKNLFDYFFFFNNENKLNLFKLYNNQNFLMMIMLIIYLFITLLAIVKITNIFYGPLRSTMN
uniref:NADH-ubiquinone oxidoreductase chain 6 n=1 Tax=Stathmopoda auriferella TaxID=1421331 RepID=A0A343A130_9NEOP|nr:NADH dehydrogenase subunit 6 [Stathmopoda auriferella]AOX13386.1 NADH dehydrogenase subunit 6 [Stathmopoda auriferella]